MRSPCIPPLGSQCDAVCYSTAPPSVTIACRDRKLTEAPHPCHPSHLASRASAANESCPPSCPTMPEFFESIPGHLIPWLLDQPVFWVATAPLSKDGHVNLSPKGLKGSFRVNNANEVWYEDLMGSGRSFTPVVWAVSTDRRVPGIETVSHVRENGRITLLFSALSGPPRTVRLFGKGPTTTFIPVSSCSPGSLSSHRT